MGWSLVRRGPANPKDPGGLRGAVRTGGTALRRPVGRGPCQEVTVSMLLPRELGDEYEHLAAPTVVRTTVRGVPIVGVPIHDLIAPLLEELLADLPPALLGLFPDEA
jgi:hypothetical protein